MAADPHLRVLMRGLLQVFASRFPIDDDMARLRFRERFDCWSSSELEARVVHRLR